MKKKDIRAAIINSTIGVIADHGFHQAPMSTIANRAGVATGTTYRFFQSKDELILETMS